MEEEAHPVVPAVLLPARPGHRHHAVLLAVHPVLDRALDRYSATFILGIRASPPGGPHGQGSENLLALLAMLIDNLDSVRQIGFLNYGENGNLGPKART